MRKLILLLTLAVSLGACASNGTQTAASAEGEPKTKRDCTQGESTSSRLRNRGC